VKRCKNKIEMKLYILILLNHNIKMDKARNDTEIIRDRMIIALEMIEKYNLEFKNLCIKHAMVCDIEDTKDTIEKQKLIDSYKTSIYYKY